MCNFVPIFTILVLTLIFSYGDYGNDLLTGPNVSKLISFQSLFHVVTTFSDANLNNDTLN